MLTSIRGIYRKGRVELEETPRNLPDEARVIVTFLAPAGLDLSERGIDEEQAAELRARLASFADDWNDAKMDAYDDYDATKARL
jgi:hypothetical protein